MPSFLFPSVFLPLLDSTAQPADPAAGTSGGGALLQLLPFLLIIVVMYFLMIRPQQKRQKQHQAMLAAVKTGDEVVTMGGVYGTIAGVDDKDNTLWLKISGDVKVKVDRGAIARVVKS